MTQPTKDEMQLLEKFRYNIRDLDLTREQNEDMFLVSWIRARENDLIKAEDMLRKSLIWRKANDIENILTWVPPENYKVDCPWALTGKDIDGRPVGIIPLGIWNVKKQVDAGQRDIYVKYVDQFLQALLADLKNSSDSQGRKHTQFVIVFDMKGLTLRQFTSPSTVETILETFRRFEANFPETLKTAFVINAPRIFGILYNIVKPLLSGRTIQKAKIFNSSRNKWELALLAEVSKFNLPTSCGGVNTKYDKILAGLPDYKEDDEGCELLEVTVEAGSKHEVHLDVKEIDTLLKWEFHTVDYDIGFSILYEEKEEVSSYTRFNSHVNPEEGSLICKNPGKYTLQFDNTYSRLRAKTLRYLVSIDNNNE